MAWALRHVWFPWWRVHSKELLCLERNKNGFPFRMDAPTIARMVSSTSPCSGSEAPLKVSVWRGRAVGAFSHYEVPRQASQTVLDVITFIQRRLEPSLGYRFACRVGMCGSCAMTVNGKARWTCRTHVSRVVDGQGAIQVAPLANLPVVKDLVTDMSVFFDKWAAAKGQFKGTGTRDDGFAQVAPDSPARVAANAGIECIGCAVCYASCDVVGWRPDYLGPAAMNRAWTLVNDVRDVQQRERLRAVAGDAGCHSCHTQGSCTEHCPKHLTPTLSIAGLKRVVGKAAVRGQL
jgi:fumarate reductase iron-sulfur subunit